MDSIEPGVCRLTCMAFLSILFRSLFIQGSFSRKFRQNVGFAYCMEPVGRCLRMDVREHRRFTERHLEDFNGNPFMCTLVIGAVARMEERLRNGQGGSESEIGEFKRALGAATGAVGDRLFWGALRPFALVLGLFSIYFFGMWGALVFFSAYNIPNIVLRWYWLRLGYRKGSGIIADIKNPNIERAIGVTEALGASVLGFMTALILVMPQQGITRMSAVSLGAFGLIVLMLRWKKFAR